MPVFDKLLTLYLIHAGEQGDFWEKQHFDLTQYNIGQKNYEVVISGTIGDGHIGDIAIDDITLSRGCSRSAFQLKGHPDGTPLTPIGMCELSYFLRNTPSCSY